MHVLHPTSFQQKDKSLIEIAKEHPNDFSIKRFLGAGKTYSLICRKVKFMVIKQMQKSLVEWYHNVPCHLGKTRTKFLANPFY